jgi:ribosomal protein L40E
MGLFMHGASAGPLQRSGIRQAKGEQMRLFRRQKKVEDEPARCPVCTERLPDEADQCRMCGADLRALRPSSHEVRMA